MRRLNQALGRLAIDARQADVQEAVAAARRAVAAGLGSGFPGSVQRPSRGG